MSTTLGLCFVTLAILIGAMTGMVTYRLDRIIKLLEKHEQPNNDNRNTATR